MPERKTRTAKWSRIQRILKTGQVAERGNVACVDRTDGALVVAGVAPNLFPVGYFEESLSGDGVRKVGVRLFAEIDVHLLNNATVGPVADDDVGALCYLHSANEVSMTGTGKSVAGRVARVDPDGVWVQMALSLENPPGP